MGAKKARGMRVQEFGHTVVKKADDGARREEEKHESIHECEQIFQLQGI